jgi:hypothetical protein
VCVVFHEAFDCASVSASNDVCPLLYACVLCVSYVLVLFDDAKRGKVIRESLD